MNGYDIREAVPSIADYCRLRAISGLSAKSAEAAGVGLPNSIHAVVALTGEAVVGMGRVIGDGGLFYQIVDVAVDPAHQGRGLGKAIMALLMERLKTSALEGAYVSLIADGAATALYAQFGFAPTGPKSIGMALTITHSTGG